MNRVRRWWNRLRGRPLTPRNPYLGSFSWGDKWNDDFVGRKRDAEQANMD